MKRSARSYNPQGSQPPNRNDYSVDGSMRYFSDAGLSLYREHFIAYSKAHGRNQRIVAVIDQMPIDHYFIYCGAMRVDRMPGFAACNRRKG